LSGLFIIGGLGWRWFSRRLRAATGNAKAGFVALLVCAGLFYIGLLLFVFDLAYLAMSMAIPTRVTPRMRGVISSVILVACLAGVAAANSNPKLAASPSPSPAAVAVASPRPTASPTMRATAAVTQTPTATPQATARPTVTQAPTSTPLPRATPTPKPTATPNKLTAAQVAQVKSILSASLAHYKTHLANGKAALGTERYADAFEGLAALSDPSSGAYKFSHWRTSSKAEYDVSYLDEFSKADDFYNGNNEPSAIVDWRDDMGDLQMAISDWVDVAVAWQISEKTSAELAAAESTVQSAFAKVQKDIDLTVTQSQ
jgi:hypothetical protein